ncbi:hypothetical protein NYV56_25945, partial [Escherichia coli]|nr:hypothetical protein [Escherichia coli]
KLRDEWVEEGYEWLFNLYGRSATGITVVLGALVWLISTMQEILTMARSISACGAILCEYFSGGVVSGCRKFRYSTGFMQ